eukprot:g78912.t1
MSKVGYAENVKQSCNGVKNSTRLESQASVEDERSPAAAAKQRRGQQQRESKSSDTGSPSTKLGDCSSQQQCESKIEELREILRELPSWDSEDLPFESLLRVLTPGEEICTIVAREACRILRKEHPNVWGLVDPQIEYMVERTEAQRKSKQACYDRIYRGSVNPAGSKPLGPPYVRSFRSANKFETYGIRNFGNTCYLNTALQAIAPMFTEAACVESCVPSSEREFGTAEPHYGCLRSYIHFFPFSNIRMSSLLTSSQIFRDYVDRQITTQSAMNEDLHTVVTRLHEWEGVLVQWSPGDGGNLEVRGVQKDVSSTLRRINECMSMCEGQRVHGPSGGWVVPAPICQGGLPLQRLTFTHRRISMCNHCHAQTTGPLPVFPTFNAHPAECFVAEPLELAWPGETKNDGTGGRCTVQELVDHHFRDEILTQYNCSECCKGATRRTVTQRLEIIQEEGPAWLAIAVARVCLQGHAQRKIVREVKVSSMVNIPVRNQAGAVQITPYQVVVLGNHEGKGSAAAYKECSTGLRLIVLKRMVNAQPASLLFYNRKQPLSSNLIMSAQTSSLAVGPSNSGGAGDASGSPSQFIPSSRSSLVLRTSGTLESLNTPPRSGSKACEMGNCREREWSDALHYYDSIPKTNPNTVRKQRGVLELLKFAKLSECNLKIMESPSQDIGSNGCFVFAIAMAVSLLHGLGPVRKDQYAGKSSVCMRLHLLSDDFVVFTSNSEMTEQTNDPENMKRLVKEAMQALQVAFSQLKVMSTNLWVLWLMAWAPSSSVGLAVPEHECIESFDVAFNNWRDCKLDTEFALPIKDNFVNKTKVRLMRLASRLRYNIQQNAPNVMKDMLAWGSLRQSLLVKIVPTMERVLVEEPSASWQDLQTFITREIAKPDSRQVEGMVEVKEAVATSATGLGRPGIQTMYYQVLGEATVKAASVDRFEASAVLEALDRGSDSELAEAAAVVKSQMARVCKKNESKGTNIIHQQELADLLRKESTPGIHALNLKCVEDVTRSRELCLCYRRGGICAAYKDKFVVYERFLLFGCGSAEECPVVYECFFLCHGGSAEESRIPWLCDQKTLLVSVLTSTHF